MKKTTLVKLLALLMLLFVSVGSTLAYLTDVKQEVNVMTLGRVEIDLIEQERNSASTLVDFQDFHPLYPGYYPKGLEAFDKDGYWLNVQNAVDKIVTVKNTGAAPAYVRLWFAFEVTDEASFFDSKIHLNRNTTDWQWEFMYDKTTGNFDFLTQDGSRYVVATATYNQVLAPNATTPVSLRQVLLDSSATNDDFEKLGDKYSIFVVAQGMQTAGFDSAAVALAEGFGVPSVKNHPFAGMKEENTVFCCTQMDLRTVVSPKDDNTHTESQICINCGKIRSVISVTHRYNSSGTCACGATEKPAEPTDTPFKWTSDGKSITITQYLGTDTDVVIPATIDGLPVTDMGKGAFASCTTLTSVTIPDSMTSIGDAVFYGCTSLTSITIPDSVTSIDICAFEHCTSLTSITLPDRLTSIGNWAFSSCSSLTSITIPDSVTSIGNGAFNSCTSLTSIHVGVNNSYYTAVEGVLFDNNRSTLHIYPAGKSGVYSIPNSVTSINSNAFYGCTSLTSITIPNSVTSIGNGAFYGCTSLTSITIPNSVTSINSSTFHGCTSLASVIIPDSVTSIGASAFEHCTSLTSITLPDRLTSIGSWAFSSCSSLTSITIPDSVTSIDDCTFQNCSALRNITIPDSVNSIGVQAFYNCVSLTSVILPDNVISIGDSVFSSCSSLTSITLPNRLTSIGDWAFYHCSSLTSITIPDSVTSIGYLAFDKDKLTVYGSTDYVNNWCAQYGVNYKPLS